MSKYQVEISGINTSDLITLSYDEMKKLFIKMKMGDSYARELLIDCNLKLVLSILRKFYNKTDNLDDLFQIGCIGLIKAIDNFDLHYDVQFSTYAVPMILGEIKRYIRDNNSIRISRSIKDLFYKISCFMDKYYQENGKEASYSLVAETLGVSEFDVCNAIIAMKDNISMYEPVYSDGGDTIYLYDQIVDDSSVNNFSDKVVVDNAIMELSERETYILDQRYVVGKTQMEIADNLNISQAQVSRLEKKAIRELKKVLK